jgi:hypothetical protein
VKNIRKQTLFGAVAFFACALLVQAAPGDAHYVRYHVEAAFDKTDVDTDASGEVLAVVRERGKSEVQRLRLNFSNLDARATYTLLARIDGETEFAEVDTFTTSSAGKARIAYVQTSGSAKKKRALPPALNPLTGVQSLAIANTNGEVVLTVDLHAAERMSFELASVLENTGNDPDAIGCLAVSCFEGNVQFRLIAAGQSSLYTLSVNEKPVATYQANAAGTVVVGAFPAGAPSPLAFKRVSMQDVSAQVVLQSELR